jgi:signal transduction histidine kinase/ActR/RegA family two-component response regulator
MTDTRLHALERLAAIGGAGGDVPALLDEALDVLLSALEGTVGGAFLTAGAAGSGPLVGGRGPLGADLVVMLRGQYPGEGPTAFPSQATLHLAGQGSPLPGALGSGDVGALAMVPLRSGDQVVGSVLLAWGTAPDAPAPDVEFLRLAGAVVGLAVEKARLADDLSARLRRAQALYRVSRALASTLDLDHLLSLIVSFAVDTIEKASNGVLHLLDEDTGELHPRALSFQPGVLPDTSGRNRMRLGHGIAGCSLAEGVLVNIPDVARDPRFVQTPGSRRFAAMMVAPLLLGERRVGTLSVDATAPNAFSQEDEQLLLTLATMAAAAIDNARLISYLQESLNSLKMTQEQLIQSAKLSAVGQLISGLAHELNNPLTAIMGYVQLLSIAEDLPRDIRADLDKIHSQAQRAAAIVQNLLTFARQRKQEAQLVDVNEVLERTLELRAYQLRRADVEIVTNLAEGPLGVMAAPGQLQQVFLQLMNNAQDALRANTGPRRLTLTTARDDALVRVRVADNGPGLSAEARAHLFEPFFTTKEVGEGAGLGLSISFGIVSQYGGTIYAEEDPPEGAAFVVEFPTVREPIVGEEVPARAPAEAVPAGNGHILVVDDEPEVAALLEAILLEDGHRVEISLDGEAALERLARASDEGQPFDLILSDINMPAMRGPELYARLAEANSILARRLIFITGDALDPTTLDFLRANDLTYVEKPFSLDDLSRAVDHVRAQSSG